MDGCGGRFCQSVSGRDEGSRAQGSQGLGHFGGLYGRTKACNRKHRIQVEKKHTLEMEEIAAPRFCADPQCHAAEKLLGQQLLIEFSGSLPPVYRLFVCPQAKPSPGGVWVGQRWHQSLLADLQGSCISLHSSYLAHLRGSRPPIRVDEADDILADGWRREGLSDEAGIP